MKKEELYIKIKDICESRNYNYHEQINYLSELMKKADLAIGAGGLTNWERIYVGLPSICTIVAENQKDGTTYAGDINICINLGWYKNVKIITYKNILNKPISSKCILWTQKNLQLSRFFI